MACVIECPDTAILGKVVPKAKLEAELAADPRRSRARALSQAVRQDDQVLERLREEGRRAGLLRHLH
ncbi:MAG: hypothetical protein V9H26_11555 [Verrucomicrobiota bacterium]